MKIRSIVVCCVFLMSALPALADEAELALPRATPEEATVPLDCPEMSLESEAEIAGWATQIGANAEAGRVDAMTLPACPIPIPDCPGLVPVGCDPDSACRETSSCTVTDLGFRRCEVAGTKVSCPAGETFHTSRCDCEPTCAGAFCGSTRNVFCQ